MTLGQTTPGVVCQALICAGVVIAGGVGRCWSARSCCAGESSGPPDPLPVPVVAFYTGALVVLLTSTADIASTRLAWTTAGWVLVSMLIAARPTYDESRLMVGDRAIGTVAGGIARRSPGRGDQDDDALVVIGTVATVVAAVMYLMHAATPTSPPSSPRRSCCSMPSGRASWRPTSTACSTRSSGCSWSAESWRWPRGLPAASPSLGRGGRRGRDEGAQIARPRGGADDATRTYELLHGKRARGYCGWGRSTRREGHKQGFLGVERGAIAAASESAPFCASLTGWGVGGNRVDCVGNG